MAQEPRHLTREDKQREDAENWGKAAAERRGRSTELGRQGLRCEMPGMEDRPKMGNYLEINKEAVNCKNQGLSS